MNDTSLDISQELSGLGSALSELAGTLRHASLRLLEEGLLPTESLVEQIIGIRSELKSIRARICRLARDRGIAVPPVSSIDSIKAIEAIFEQVREVEGERARSREGAAALRSVIRKVLTLRHDRLAEYAPLAACQERARAFMESALSMDSEGTESSAKGLEPFAALIALVEDRIGAGEVTRDSAARRVEEYFGRSLAAAAVAGAIVLSQKSLEGFPASRYQTADGSRRIRPMSELGIGLLEAPLAHVANDGFNNSSPWFSGLGRSPRMVHDDSYRPIVHETFFSPESRVGRHAFEASAGASTVTGESLTKSEDEDEDEAEAAETPIEGESSVVAQEVQQSIKEARQRVHRGDSGMRAASAVGDFLVFRTDPYPSGRSRKLGNAVRRRTQPGFEQLETLRLLSCNVISGFVYLDNNVDGLYDAGDTPIPNNPVQLYNASNQLVGSTTSDSAGAYSFNSNSTISTATQTEVKSASVSGTTNYIMPIDVPKFDPSLGTLTGVVVDFTGEIDSRIQAENNSVSSGDTVNATQNGDISLIGPGLKFDVPLSHAPLTASLTTFDGTQDYGGTSGVDFGRVTSSDTASKTLSTAAGDDLSVFSGTGNYEGFVNAAAIAKVLGGGNLDYNTLTNSTVSLKLTYKYTPTNCLSPGQYTVVQPVEPTGTLNGRESSHGVILPYKPVLPNKIAVTLSNMDSVNNNFGQILPGGLGGYVYVDANKNGIKDTGETPLANVPIKLTGTNNVGESVTLFTTTDGNGSYSFTGLRPGIYTTMETQQPAGYEDGQETRGNVTPIPNSIGTDTIPDIPVTAGNFTPNNNYGEYIPGTPGGGGGGELPLTTVNSVEREGIHHQMTTIIVHFNNGLDPATANNPSYYHLRRIFPGGKIAQGEIPIESVVYNPANNSVTLTPAYRLNIHDRYLLTINGLLSNTNPPQPIDGDNNGTPGGTYVTVVSKANYPHPLSGPGVIHQSLPNRGRLAARSANPGLARQHLVHTQMLGRGLSR